MKWLWVMMLAFGFTPTEAFARGHGHPGAGKHLRGMKMKAMKMALKKADLSDDQREQLKSIRQKHKAAMEKLRQGKKAAGPAVMALLDAEDPDSVSFEAIQRQRKQLRLSREKLHFQHMKAMVLILEPEQRKKVAVELRRLRAQWGQRAKRRMMRRWKKGQGHRHGGPEGFGHQGEFED